MPSISSYFNPCSKEFKTCSDFAQLNIGSRIGVVILTALAAICSLGILAFPTSRLLVRSFLPLDPLLLPQAPLKTHQSGLKLLSNAAIPTDQSVMTAAMSPQNNIVSTPSAKIVSAPLIPLNTQINQAVATAQKNKDCTHELFVESLGGISRRSPVQPLSTRIVLESAEVFLRTKGKTLGNALENEFSFFHAFCQLYNCYQHQESGRAIDIQFVLDLCKRLLTTNRPGWLDKWFTDFPDLAHFTNLQQYNSYYSQSKIITPPPIGFPTREGKLLCDHKIAQFDLIVYCAEHDLKFDRAMELLNPNNKTELDVFLNSQNVYVSVENSVRIQNPKSSIEMFMYKREDERYCYLPIFRNDDLEKMAQTVLDDSMKLNGRKLRYQ